MTELFTVMCEKMVELVFICKNYGIDLVPDYSSVLKSRTIKEMSIILKCLIIISTLQYMYMKHQSLVFYRT